MTALVGFLVKSIVRNPDAVQVNAVEGEASTLLELHVHADDVGRVNGPDGETLRAIRTVLSASAGQRKVMLELIDPSASGDEE